MNNPHASTNRFAAFLSSIFDLLTPARAARPSAIGHPQSAIGRLAALALFLVFAATSFGQTFYSLSSGNYSEGFADMANWTNNYAAGSGASNWRVAGNATGSTGLSDTAVFTSSTSGGVQKGTQTLNFLATGTNSGATDLLMNFSGRIAGNLSFSFDKVVNTANASPRTSDLKIQYSTNNGTSFTDLSPYTIPRISNNSTAESGSRDVALPSALNGQSQVVIRFFFWNNGQTGGSGNRPKWAIDNVAVTSTSAAPSSQATSFGSSGITSSNATISWVRGNGDAGVLVVARSGGAVNADPTDNTNYTASATFGSGTQIGTGNWVVYKGTGTSVNVTGLSPSTAYHFAIYEYNSTGTTHNMTELTGSITTSAGLSAPTLSSPTATSITTTSATLGATVTADGGASLSARGTVWGTTASPTGNSLAEGGTSVAAFTHSRTGLTANTAYFYRGYATNSQGTAYSADGTFTTLPLPPTVGTGSAAGENGFTANWTHPTMGSAAYTYTVEVDDDINFGSINATVSSISSSSTSQAITGLSPSTTYYYRIKSVNAQGDSTWSATSAGISTTAAASLIAGWDFQTTATGGTAVVVAQSTPTLFVANFGSGTLFLNGTNGSSSWSQATELNGFAGTSNNTDGTSFSTTTTTPAALALLGGSGTPNSANGKSIVFRFSMRTYESLSVSYSTQKTSTGFDSHLWEYSSDGSSWTTAETIGSIPSSFGAKTLASISALNGAQDAYLRVTFSGSTGTSQNNRLDNIQIKGVPRPTIQTSGTPAALTTTYGTASSNTTFTVNGTFMTAGILVTPPSGFEVSTDGTSYSSTVTVGSSGSIANTTVYLRLAATASAGAKSGNIVLSSSGATNVNVATTASTVNQKAVTITGLSASNKTFDANTTVSVTGTPTYSGLENGETTAVTGSVSWAFPDANVGNNKSLTRTGSYNAPSANYSLTQPTLTANITARALTITANGTSKVFGNTLTGGAGSTAFTSSGLQGTDSLASVTIAYGSGAASGDAAGAYPGSITPSAAVFGSGSASNYSISYVAGTLTVTQATQTISFSALSAVTYGDAAFGLGATASSGLSVSYTSSNTSVATISGSTVTILAAGSTTITASQAGNANYSAAANVNQTLTVNTKSLTGSFTANNKTYDGTTSATVATRAVTGTVGADVVNHTGGTATFANAAVGNGKTVTLAGATLTGTAAANYSLSSVSTTTANITAASVTVTAGNQTKTFGASDPTLTYTSSPSSLIAGNSFTGALSRAAGEGVGTYAISQGTLSAGSNYTISFVGANLTITQATPTVSVAPTASAITYGQALSNSTITPGTSSVAGTYAFASPATTPAVGTASQSITFTPTDTGNYTTASTSASVTVNQAALTITGISIANKTYDGNTTATITGTAAYSGLVLGETHSVTGTGSATFGNSTVGSNKPVTVSGYTAPNGNYSITQPTGLTGNITARAITITAGNQTKTYGSTSPASGTLNTNFSLTAGTLAAGESLSGATLGYSSSGQLATATVGNYTITPSALTISGGGASAGNYDITYATGTLTVNPATLTITAGNQSVTYGTPAATVTGAGNFTATGFQNSETPAVISGSVSYTTNYTNTTAAGTAGVTITPDVSGLSATNYNFTPATGTVTVTKATPTITTAPTASSITSGQTLASSNLSGGAASVAGTFAFTTPSTAPAVGTSSQSVTFTPTDTTNYNTATTNVDVTVGSANPVVTASTFSGTVGTAFSESIIATGSPTSYGLQSGTLPAGLSLNTSTGAITGTPTAAATGTTVTINATNGAGPGSATITFNIAKGASSATVTGTTSFTFTGSAQGPDTSTTSGSTGAVTYSYSGTGGTSYGPSATKPTNAGTYSATATLAADANYNSATSSALAFTIAQRAITVTAGNQTKSFGATSPTTGNATHVSVTSGSLAGSDAVSSATLAYSGSPTGDLATARAGTYTITPSALALSPGSASNYAITYANGTLTISAVNATITTGTAGSPDNTSVSITGSNVTADGGGTVTARGIAYGTRAFPTTANSTTSDGTGTGSFNTNLTGLTPGVTYFFRAYATNAAGTAYGAQGNFTTTAPTPLAPVLSRASMPTNSLNVTINWADLANETSYELQHSTNSTFSANTTTVSGIAAGSTSQSIAVGAGLRFVRVRGVNGSGNGTWSNVQTLQVQSIPAGSTRYLSIPGSSAGGNGTIAQTFGPNNEAGLVSAASSTSTMVILQKADGSSEIGVWYFSGNWLRSGSNVNNEVIPTGRAFMIRNQSNQTDHIVISGTAFADAEVPPAVTLTSNVTIVAPVSTSPVPLTGSLSHSLPFTQTSGLIKGLRITATPTAATDFKAATTMSQADQMVVIATGAGQTSGTYWYSTRTTGTRPNGGWCNGSLWLSRVPDISPASVIMIRRGSGSTLGQWTPPGQ